MVGGTIAGRITDSSGAAVEHAHVALRNTDNGQVRTLETGREGSFSAPSEPVGHYTVEVSASTFATYRAKDVELTIAQTLELPIVMRAASTEVITVESSAPAVNLSTEQSSGLINSQEVKELPLNGRSFDQLITLNPGTVNYTNQRSGGVGTSNSSVGSMFSVSGRRPQDNLFLLNGIEYTGASLINVTPGGASGQLLGVDGIHEFNVVRTVTRLHMASAMARRSRLLRQAAPTSCMATRMNSCATATLTRAITLTAHASQSSS